MALGILAIDCQETTQPGADKFILWTRKVSMLSYNFNLSPLGELTAGKPLSPEPINSSSGPERCPCFIITLT